MGIEDYEISLKDLITVLLNRKKLILIITIIALAFSTSIAINMPNEYESAVTLILEPVSSYQETQSIAYYNKYPVMDIYTYNKYIVNSEILDKTIQQLNLSDITSEMLAKMIQVESVKDTNLQVIRVKNKSPQTAADIANTIANYVQEHMSVIYQNQSTDNLTYMKNQLELAKRNLKDKANQLKIYFSENRSIEEIKSELSTKISLLTKYKSDINSINIQIESDKATISNIEEIAGNLNIGNNIINLISGDSGTNSEIELKISDPQNLRDTIYALHITNTKISLAQNISQVKSLQMNIKEIENEITQLQKCLPENEYEYNELKTQYTLLENICREYETMIKQETMAAASQVGDTYIQVWSAATVPQSAAGPNRSLIACAGVGIGFMTGIFIALFKEYWQNETFKQAQTEVIKSERQII